MSPRYVDELRRRYAASSPPWLAPALQCRHSIRRTGRGFRRGGTNAQQPVRRESVGDRPPVRRCRRRDHGSLVRSHLPRRCRVAGASEAHSRTACGWSCTERPTTGSPAIARNWKRWRKRAGVNDLVSERPERVSYRRSLELLVESDGGFVLGVDDPGYMPSKLFSYALSGKPLLVSLHRDSPAFAQCQAIPELAHVLWFDGHGAMPLPDAVRVARGFRRRGCRGHDVRPAAHAAAVPCAEHGPPPRGTVRCVRGSVLMVRTYPSRIHDRPHRPSDGKPEFASCGAGPFRGGQARGLLRAVDAFGKYVAVAGRRRSAAIDGAPSLAAPIRPVGGSAHDPGPASENGGALPSALSAGATSAFPMRATTG